MKLNENLTIANTNIRVSSNSHHPFKEIDMYFNNFLGKPNQKNELNFLVEYASKKLKEGYWCKVENAQYPKGILINIDEPRFSFCREDVEGNFDIKTNIAKCVISPEQLPNYRTFYDIFRLVFALYVLLNKKEILIHSSLMNINGEGYLFVGPAGIGKSTLTKKLSNKGFEIITDEFPLISKKNNKLSLYGTPFAGDFLSLNKTIPLKKIFILKRGDSPKIKKLEGNEALINLLNCDFILMSLTKKEIPKIIKRISHIYSDIIKQGCVFELTLDKEYKYVDKLLEYCNK